jgi:hypothetical protein
MRTAPLTHTLLVTTLFGLAVACGSNSGNTDGGASGGSGGSGGMQNASCDQSAKGACQLTPTSGSNLEAAANLCKQAGGTPGTACPTANLVGCCTIEMGEQCYYKVSPDAEDAESICKGGGGSWATTP